MAEETFCKKKLVCFNRIVTSVFCNVFVEVREYICTNFRNLFWVFTTVILKFFDTRLNMCQLWSQINFQIMILSLSLRLKLDLPSYILI